MLTNKQYRLAVIMLIMLYMVLFVARVVYDLALPESPDMDRNVYYSGPMSEKSSMTRNIASLRMEYQFADGVEVLDQKYERIATLASRTISFETDERLVNTAIENAKAVVQMENIQGLIGDRRLTLVIGVKPQFFDDCKNALAKVGTITSSTVTKTDRTYEYRQMLAEKEKLERQRDSFSALRAQGGSISELLNLEERIIGVESQIMQQSVSLGEYSDDNALCTINFSLNEGSVASIPRKLWNSLRWASGVYAGGMGLILLTLFAAYIFVKLYILLRKYLVSKKIIISADNAPNEASPDSASPDAAAPESASIGRDQ
jgi:hypothetical protein